MAQDQGIKRTVRSTGTIAGDAATKVPATDMSDRRGVIIHNPNATYDIWVFMVSNGGAAPTITATNRDFVVAQDQTLFIPASEGIDIYLMNSSGGATTSEYCVTETDYAPPASQVGKQEVTLGGSVTATVTPPTVSSYYLLCDGTDELLISASARKVYGIDVFSLDATPVYAKLYDKATAPSEADTPIHVEGCPANSTAANGAKSNNNFSQPISLTSGLGIRVVTGIAVDNDSAVTASEVVVNVRWSA